MPRIPTLTSLVSKEIDILIEFKIIPTQRIILRLIDNEINQSSHAKSQYRYHKYLDSKKTTTDELLKKYKIKPLKTKIKREQEEPWI